MTRRHDEGDGRHNNSNDDGDRRQHGDGKGQQGDRRYNDGDGRQDEVAQRRRRAANYYD